jgi:hypothetical protein
LNWGKSSSVMLACLYSLKGILLLAFALAFLASVVVS